MKSDQTIIQKNLMEQLHFITNLLDIKDPNIKIMSLIWIPSRLTFLTLKRLACLLEFSLKSALSKAIIAQKLVEKTSMTDIPHQLSISTSTVIRKLNDFSRLPKTMSWDEYAFKMSFIVQGFKNLNIITVLEVRTQAIIRKHFLSYDRAVCSRMKIINTLQLPYSIAKLEATNHLIKLIKRNIFGFRNFDNFKKRVVIALNIKMEKTKIVPSRF